MGTHAGHRPPRATLLVPAGNRDDARIGRAPELVICVGRRQSTKPSRVKGAARREVPVSDTWAAPGSKSSVVRWSDVAGQVVETLIRILSS